ncbi:MAG: energy transducer TonB [Bacteroidetes bacterium]|nr:energy transducer TonB [Bacteroidota bacterium]
MRKPLFYLILSICLFFSSTSFSQTSQKTNSIPEDTVFTEVKQMPSFPGGRDSLNTFMNRNIVYPSAAKEAGKSGWVYSCFIVEKDGTLSGAEIFRGIGYGCDEEVLRAIKLMPKWEPGLHEGKPVRVKQNWPVHFVNN